MWETMSSPELLNLSLGNLLHPLANLIDLAANHIVELTVVPDQLDVTEDLLIGGVFAREELLFASG